MVVIFGWGAGEAKDLGEIAPATCPNCHNDVYLHHIQSDKKVSLYFVPLVKYGSNEYLACPICRAGMPVRPEQRAAIDRMRAATSAYRKSHLDQAYYLSTVQAFWAGLGVGPSGQQVLHAPTTVPTGTAGPGGGPQPLGAGAAAPTRALPAGAAPPTSAGTPTLAQQLKGLGKLHADGVLTDAEFAAAKARLIGR